MERVENIGKLLKVLDPQSYKLMVVSERKGKSEEAIRIKKIIRKSAVNQLREAERISQLDNMPGSERLMQIEKKMEISEVLKEVLSEIG